MKLFKSVPTGRYIQVAVAVRGTANKFDVSIDPWDNCPSEIAKEEGRYCNECEFWAHEVKGIDWSEFSLCLFDNVE